MEQIGCRGVSLFSDHHLCSFFFLLFACVFLCNPQRAEGYENYTVGDSLGWYDSLEVSNVNYQEWAAGKNFSLGDFLIFNTDKNHSVVQTYNETTYKQCDYNNAQDDDTTEWGVGAPTVDKVAVTVAVPLLKERMNYFFSGDYDGEQCMNGQRFQINVTHGQGLPESLMTPAASTESPAPSGSADDSTVPDTVIPSNFNDPQGVGAVNGSSESGGTLTRVGSCEGGVVIISFGLVLCGLIGVFG